MNRTKSWILLFLAAAAFLGVYVGRDKAEQAPVVRTQLRAPGIQTPAIDPAGDKLSFLREAAEAGYTVVLCYVGIASPRLSQERVAMRISQGGHDVPSGKLKARFPRTLANLQAAIRTLPHVLVFDNSDLRHPFRWLATFENGRCVLRAKALPRWFRPLLGSTRP